MIRIEGIPIVAARLAAMQKSTKAPQPSRPSRRRNRRRPCHRHQPEQAA